MKLTKKARKLIIEKIKEGDYNVTNGIYDLTLSNNFVSISMIWYKTGSKCTSICTSIEDYKGDAIEVPIGWWDEWLIQRALKKCCGGVK